MEPLTVYQRAHLLVASARIFAHKHSAPPLVEDVASDLGFSVEDAQLLANQLARMGVLELVSSVSGQRIFVKDPGPLEELPREEQPLKMQQEIARFAMEQKAKRDRLKGVSEEEKQRKKDLFAALSQQIKEKMDEKGPP